MPRLRGDEAEVSRDDNSVPGVCFGVEAAQPKARAEDSEASVSAVRKTNTSAFFVGRSQVLYLVGGC